MNDLPIYVSEKSAKNLWQDYRVFSDRIELRCWALFSRFVIPADEILGVEVRPPFRISDIFGGRAKLTWWVIKLDWSDLFEHVEIYRKSGLFKRLSFTPDNPPFFVAACNSIRPTRS